MRKKSSRRHIEVNVGEPDRLIDDARTVPLSEQDSHKLKTALHALAERLLPRPKTDKTSTVFGDAETHPPEDPQAKAETTYGHGRNGGVEYHGTAKPSPSQNPILLRIIAESIKRNVQKFLPSHNSLNAVIAGTDCCNHGGNRLGATSYFCDPKLQ